MTDDMVARKLVPNTQRGHVVACKVARRLDLNPQLAAVPAPGEPAQEVERLGQHVMLGHGFQARDIEVAEQALQRGAAFPAHAAPRGNALPIVLGVENDHAALLHVSIDIGQRHLGKRSGVGQHRPVEDWEKPIASAGMLTANGLAGLHGGARDQELVEADQTLAARPIGDRGGRADGAEAARPPAEGSGRGGLAMGKMYRVYSVTPGPKQQDFWLDGDGFNLLLQALPLHGLQRRLIARIPTVGREKCRGR